MRYSQQAYFFWKYLPQNDCASMLWRSETVIAKTYSISRFTDNFSLLDKSDRIGVETRFEFHSAVVSSDIVGILGT